jgi:hypothetical protein
MKTLSMTAYQVPFLPQPTEPERGAVLVPFNPLHARWVTALSTAKTPPPS